MRTEIKTPWSEEILLMMRQVMSSFREKQQDVNIYDEIRRMNIKALRKFVRLNKHSGYFNKQVKDWTNYDTKIAWQVSYAKQRLKCPDLFGLENI
jgi:hypothetical protein